MMRRTIFRREALRTSVLVIIGLLSGGFGQGALAAGDFDAGAVKSAACAACHGAEGIALAPNWPNLAGQYEDYLVHALRGYRSGTRQNAIMQGFAGTLSDQDIDDLAAYFSAQSGPMQTAPRGDSK